MTLSASLGGVPATLRLAGRGVMDTYAVGTIPTTTTTYETGTIRMVTDNLVVHYTDAGQYRGRGNTTWGAPKKPFKVRSSVATKTPLGFPASRDWAYMADYFDQSYLRTTIAFEVARRATGRWAPRSHPIRLTWNDEYQGLYRYSETVQVQPGRISVRKMSNGNISGNVLTGPYLLEVNNPLGGDPGWSTAMGTPILYDVPDVAGNAAQETYIHDWVNNLEDKLVNGTEAEILALIDLPSWVDAYLIAESMRCQDSGWHKSCKWYKDQDPPNGTGKAVLWAPWDYDLSLGNDLNDGGPYEQSPTGWWTRTGPNAVTAGYPNWYWYAWNRCPAFRTACRERWTNDFKPVIDNIGEFIDEQYALIAPFIAEDRTEWRGGGSVPSGHTVAFLKDFIETRAEWIDSRIGFDPDTTAPTTPANLDSSSVLATTLTLTWDASTDDQILSGYEYRIDGGSAIDAGPGTTQDITGLTPETEYDFQVRAYDETGNRSSWSSVHTVATGEMPLPETYEEAILAYSPSLYWRLGDTSGTTAVDTSGNSRSGTYVGSYSLNQTSLVTGDADKAVAFSGGHVGRSYESWQNDTTFSVTAIIKPTSTGSYNAIVTNDGSGDRFWNIYLRDGQITNYYFTDGDHVITGSTTINANTAYHIVFTAGATYQRIYVNGVLDAEVANTINAPAGNNRVFLVGASVAGGGNIADRYFAFPGTIDEVAHFPAELTAAEVSILAEVAGY